MKMERNNADDIISTLEEFVSKHKKTLVDQVLEKRTRYVTLVFEDIDKPHNISAVVRTAECLGIQDLHFIKNQNAYSVNPTITQGASKWLTFHKHENAEDNLASCYSQLRDDGYKVYATSLHETSISIDDLPVDKKLAIVFGTESDGISMEAGQNADGLVHLPMYGFTESFNLSVSAALCLSALKSKMNGVFPGISQEEKVQLRAEWYRRIVREADLILKTNGVEV